MLSLKETPQAMKNWSESLQFQPQIIQKPTSIEEIVEIVNIASSQNRKIRVIGSGHSFTPLIKTNDILLSLDHLQGVIEVDENELTAEVWAGTKLSRLGSELHELGYSQENLGDINVQSVSGALLTGTHGTGVDHGVLSTQIEEVTIVLANGRVTSFSRKLHPEVFPAHALSLGLLGIVVKLKLRIVPKQNYKHTSQRMELDTALRELPRLLEENEHFEFYAFPYSSMIQVKRMNKTSEQGSSYAFEKWKASKLENSAYSILSEIARIKPSLSSLISRFSAKSVPNTAMIGPSFELFSTVRTVKFNEMEYCVPRQNIRPVLEKILEMIKQENIAVHFPVECRFVKEDDLWLSPAYQRESAYIAVHMYKGMPYEKYFHKVERIFQEYDGRPHWAKLHTMTYDDLIRLYPMLPAFIKLREQMDPKGLFVNEYLSRLLCM
ncbi:D-arabinono-1,4-lactone oxidase [Bacillus sp. 2205SS5-2]|uniref:D-arabinono-1,4-lactone oxidase n=1 Tax=Bacillus sp. 2205SS5-2 TaxID=3109031 RepID=UPI0030074CCE